MSSIYLYVEKKVLEYNGAVLTHLTRMFDYVG